MSGQLEYYYRKAQMRHCRHVTAGVITRFLGDQRQCRGCFHSEDKALDGLIVRTDGLDMRQFRRNPIVLGHHEVDKPVGRVLINTIERQGSELHATIQFADPGVDYVDDLVRLVKSGVLNGLSIGFSPTEMGRPASDGTPIVHRAVLHEISVCSIPSLGGALINERAYRGTGPVHVAEQELTPLEASTAENARREKARRLKVWREMNLPFQ
jgi:HK97 family phage prohead protease